MFRSPDFNALDLGAWHSLASGVPSLKANPNGGRIIDQIIFHVLERWRSWDATHRLENIFNTKARLMQVVLDVKGSNEYRIPRSNRTHKHEKPSYMPKGNPKERNEEEDKEGGDEEMLEAEEREVGSESADGSIQEDHVVLSDEDESSLSSIIIDISPQMEVIEYWMRRSQQN